MAIPDMPNVPPQNVPVLIAQVNQAQTGAATTAHVLGVCSPVPSSKFSLENVEEPILVARYYLQEYANKSVSAPATTTILQQPKHGVLRLVTEADRGTLFGSTADPLDPNAGLYAYLPEQGYLGKDSATILVDFGGGQQVLVKYYFQAISGVLGNDWAGDYCSKTGAFWKISSNLDANGTNTITSVEYQSPTTIATGTTVVDTVALASTLGTTLLSNLAGDAAKRGQARYIFWG